MDRPDKKTIDELLSRRVNSIVGEKELRTKLASGKPLRIKHGVDPTTPDLHLGYSVVYHKMREFQDLGHTVIFLIGDFTGRFGDPTNKNDVRQLRDAHDVREMSEHYIKQVLTILDPKKTEIRYNSEWYDKMSAEDIIRLMSHFTHAQLIERDMFQQRIKKHKEIGLHEPLYPVLQGYDSVMLESDVTIIGTDQTFNEMRGRDLQKDFGQEPQAIISVPLLIGLDGKQKMSQSLGNYIGITESPDEQYGKIMSLPDDQIYTYFELATSVPTSDLPAIKVAAKKEPRDTKARLAYEIVKIYHGEAAAKKAEDNFVGIFKKGRTPDDISEIKIKKATRLVDIMAKYNLASSKSEARRLIEQRGVRINHHIVSDPNLIVENEPGTIIQVGKRHFIQLG
ncbi:tyrosine--tRNA ligase [candidate division Kazan bacterium]|mgnify:CR=1 FL=1|uniref:Tyrosine--tRNA ligase n=1 Tax=candidate division Kazan bacterium TaxID=2202143 RepID=A0A420ZDB4_UNCK3|nr:MAG: tyrosine--tRNA ligase [candidate division Kazan bacterium]